MIIYAPLFQPFWSCHHVISFILSVLSMLTQVLDFCYSFTYCTRAIISRGLYNFYPIFTAVYVQKLLILQTIWLLSKEILQKKSEVTNQERVIMARVLYMYLQCVSRSLWFATTLDTLASILLFRSVTRWLASQQGWDVHSICLAPNHDKVDL